MPAVKLHADTLAVLAALRGRLGSGHSYDKVIQELVRRHLEQINQALMAPDRLERIEAMLVQIAQKLGDGDDDAESKPPTFKVE